MKAVIFAIILMAGLGCQKKLSRSETESRLKTAMQSFLIKRPGYDSAILKFDVQSVIYFEDKNFYECEFTVHMRERGHDTTGIMTARILKDFSTVKRKS